MKKVFAIASGGGHWKQLMRLRRGLETQKVVYATTISGLAERSGIDHFYLVPDASRSNKLMLIKLFYHVLCIIIKEKPDFVVSTGAAPGLLAIICGRLIGAKTLWIDSIANGERLSMCGRLSTRLSHLTLSQWQELCDESHVYYRGSIL